MKADRSPELKARTVTLPVPCKCGIVAPRTFHISGDQDHKERVRWTDWTKCANPKCQCQGAVLYRKPQDDAEAVMHLIATS